MTEMHMESTNSQRNNTPMNFTKRSANNMRFGFEGVTSPYFRMIQAMRGTSNSTHSFGSSDIYELLSISILHGYRSKLTSLLIK